MVRKIIHLPETKTIQKISVIPLIFPVCRVIFPMAGTVCLMGWRNRVVAAASPRVTAPDSLDSKPESTEWPINFYGFNHIAGTGRIVPTGGRQERRDGHLIKADQPDQEKTQDLGRDFPHKI